MTSQLDIELIDQALLPSNLQKLSQLIGLEPALKLVSLYPGVSLYIPTTHKTHHFIKKAIGLEAFKKLVEHYQHNTITLPKLDSVNRQIKHHILIELKKNGESNRSIALKVNYTQRHVERLVSNHKKQIEESIQKNNL